MIYKNKLQKIINHYGTKNQEDILIEEMSELTKAVIKLRRAKSNIEISNVIEEIADVKIMLNQLILILEQTEPLAGESVCEMVDFKIKRQLDRMEGEKNQ